MTFNMYKPEDRCPKIHPVIPASCIIVVILFMHYHRDELQKIFASNSTDIVPRTVSDDGSAVRNSNWIMKGRTNKRPKYNTQHRKHQKYPIRRKTFEKLNITTAKIDRQ